MKPVTSTRAGFSLIEVSAALCIISVAMISLLALVPMGLANTRTCKAETRAAELANAVFHTLSTETFTRAACFSETEPPLDFSTLRQGESASLPTLLYASYDVRREFATIVRSSILPSEMGNDQEIYRIELRNEPQELVAGSTTVPGSVLRLRIYSGREQAPIYATSSYLGRFAKVGMLPRTEP